MVKLVRGSKERSKITDEWGTPPWLMAIIKEEFPFLHLDVCASDENHKLPHYYTLEDNSLAQPWDVPYFCNPPYSNIKPWAKRASEWKATFGVHLVKYDPSTGHGRLYAEHADEIRIIEHRIKFENAPLSANFPVAIPIFRDRLYTRKTDARILYVNYQGCEK